LKNEWSDLVDDAFRQDSALNRAGLLAPDAGRVAAAMLHDPVRLNGHTIFCFVMLNKWLEANAH
jgi:asparagine synthase (glutamine-hydrolysing)